ncbi:MAG: gamma carbonic anhydrase family protein [Ruminococcaceae bacterium]|nr:gamma carbonic anhydrase family protein [Oscillospiraceae bacterium]
MIRAYKGKKPVLAQEVFLAENSVLIGDVTLEKGANIWYGAVLRGDENSITVGENTNIQDNATVHVAKACPVVLGKNVTVGHNAIVHGCTVGDGTMIGMGACVLNGAVIGKGCLIGAGALIKEGQVIPDGSLCVGVPAKIVRELDEAGKEKILANAAMYVELAKEYGEEC